VTLVDDVSQDEEGNKNKQNYKSADDNELAIAVVSLKTIEDVCVLFDIILLLNLA